MGWLLQASHSRMEEKIKEMETWPKPESVRDIQVFLGFANFYRGLIGDFTKSKRHSPRINWAMSPRAPRPRSRMHLVVPVVLVVLMELVGVTKICQVPGS